MQLTREKRTTVNPQWGANTSGVREHENKKKYQDTDMRKEVNRQAKEKNDVHANLSCPHRIERLSQEEEGCP
jgi:hypothetical protein